MQTMAASPIPIDIQSVIIRNPLFVSPETTVMDAIAQMNGSRDLCAATQTPDHPWDDLHLEARSSCVLVVDGEQVLGLLTERDIVRLSAQPQALEHRVIREVMTAPIVTLRESDLTDLVSTVHLLQQQRLDYLPLLDDHDRLVGLLTLTELLKQTVALLETENVSPLEAYTAELERQLEHRTADVKARESRERLVATIALRIRQSFELEEVLNTTATEVRQFLRADRVVVYQFQPDMSGTIITESVLPGWRVALGSQIQDTCFQHNTGGDYRASKKRAIADIYQAGLTACYVQLLEQFEVKANLVAPIVVKDRLWGLLIAHHCSAPREWEAIELNLLDQLVAQIAIAIQQATAHQQAQAELVKRQRIEATLRESEQRYATLAAISPVGMFQTDAMGNCLYVNERWCQISGLTPAEAADFGWLNGIHPADRDSVSTEWYAAIQANRPFYLEYRFQNAAGQITWVLGQAAAERDVSGEIVGYVGTITDISDRKQAEVALSQLAAIVESSADAIISETLEGVIVSWNKGAENLFGYTAAQAIGQSLLLLAPAGFEHEAAAILERLKQGVPLEHYETVRQHKDGRLIDIAVTISPIKDVTGTIIGASKIARDITDRKQAEAERLRSEKLRLELHLLESILDIILAGYWDWNMPNHQEYLSPGLKRMFGYGDDELPNTPETRQRLIVAEDRPKILDCFDRHVQSYGQVPYYNEVRYRHKDGSIVWVICSGQVIEWDITGKPLRMIGCHIDITDRKQAEEALRESEEFNKRMLESSSDCIKLIDLEGRLLYMNAGGQCIMEIDDFSHCLNAEWRSFWPEAVRLDMEAAIASAKAGQRGAFQGFCPTAKGTPKWWDVVVTPILDEAGHVAQLLAVSRDISDRKQAEELLRKNDAHLKTAQRIGKLGSWEFDLRTERITWSDEVFRLFGRDPTAEPPSFEELHQLIHPDDRDPHQQAVQAAVATIQPYEIEFRFYDPDGSLRYTQARGEPIVDTAGQLIQLVGTVLDITDRKQAEEDLRNLSDRLTLAVKSGAIGTWDWNVTENILTWDDRMYELHGITPDQFTNVYDAWARSLHPDDRPFAEAAIQKALSGEKDYDPEFRVVHPDGTIRFIKAYALVQRDAQGEPLRMIGINFDTTEQKEAEGKLLQTTAQLAASNKELEAFAYSVSHDLRSPLRAIDGFSRALLEDYGDQFDAEGKDYFDRIRLNVNRMGMLIDDLLRLSRVSRSEIHYSAVNLSVLIHDQVHELQTSEPQRQVTVVVAPGVIVSADATLMRVVISNLLQNAWKFTSHHATARIEFGAMQREGQLTYFIRDDGAGFDMAYAKMLFGVFQRLHNMHEFPGTGIGLATVQRAIHRHGGQVWADGVVEQGATIYFTVSHPPS